MLAKVISCSVVGLEGTAVEVEVDIYANSLPSITLVGLPNAPVKESTERVRAALFNSALYYPRGRVTVNLAPADLRKVGPVYDLPIAVGLLAASEQVPLERLEQTLFIGELSLDDSLRHIDGVLSMAYMAQQQGIQTVYLPEIDAPEAALIRGLEVIPVPSMSSLVSHLRDFDPIPAFEHGERFDQVEDLPYTVDFADIKGQTSTQTDLCLCHPLRLWRWEVTPMAGSWVPPDDTVQDDSAKKQAATSAACFFAQKAERWESTCRVVDA